MTFNGTAKPSNWLYPYTTERGNIFFDGDLTSSAVPISFYRYDGSLIDTFTTPTGTVVDNTRYAENNAIPTFTWRTWPSGSGTWTVSGGTLSWTGPGRGVAYIQIDGVNRAFNTTFAITSGTATVQVHTKGYAIGQTIRATVGSPLVVGALSGSTNVTAGTHTIRVVVTNTTGTTSFDVAVYLDGVLEISGTLVGVADASAAYAYGIGADAAAVGLSFERFEIEELAPLAATTWDCVNAYGATITSGVLASTDYQVTIADSLLNQYVGSGPYGWYHVRFYGTDRADGDRGFRTSYGDTYFVRMPDRTDGFPPTKPTRADSASGYVEWDEPTRGLLALGPARYGGLTTATSGATVAAQAAFADTWYRQYGTASRPRHTIGLFPDGTHPNAPAVTAIVAAAKDYIDCWEPYNEPNLDTLALATAYVTNQLAPFYAAVKAGDPNAIVLAPATVAPDIGPLQNFADAGGFSYCDAVSYHAYNQTRMDIGRGRRILADYTAAVAGYDPSLLIFQTEQGALTEWDGVFVGIEGAHDNSIQVFLQELYGIPLERNSCWYDLEHGFAKYPAWQLSRYSDVPLPSALVIRNIAAELYDTELVTRFDFNDGADFYAGGMFTRTDGTSVVGIAAQSDTLPDVRLAVTGAGASVTFVDPWGNESTLAVTGGHAFMPVFDRLVGWVRLPAGATAALVAADWGWVSEYSEAVGSSITAPASTTNASAVIDSTFNSVGSGVYSLPAENKTSTLPQEWTVDLGTLREVSRLAVRAIGPNQLTISTSVDGSSWTTRYTYSFTKQMVRYVGNHDCIWNRYDRPRDLHYVAMGLTQVRYVRLTIADSMWTQVYVPAFDTEDQANETYEADTSTWPMSFHVQIPYMRVYAGTEKRTVLIYRSA